jgi:hypothetical protein
VVDSRIVRRSTPLASTRMPLQSICGIIRMVFEEGSLKPPPPQPASVKPLSMACHLSNCLRPLRAGSFCYFVTFVKHTLATFVKHTLRAAPYAQGIVQGDYALPLRRFLRKRIHVVGPGFAQRARGQVPGRSPRLGGGAQHLHGAADPHGPLLRHHLRRPYCTCTCPPLLSQFF